VNSRIIAKRIINRGVIGGNGTIIVEEELLNFGIIFPHTIVVSLRGIDNIGSLSSLGTLRIIGNVDNQGFILLDIEGNTSVSEQIPTDEISINGTLTSSSTSLIFIAPISALNGSTCFIHKS
jgi:hypothetical protein